MLEGVDDEGGNALNVCLWTLDDGRDTPGQTIPLDITEFSDAMRPCQILVSTALVLQHVEGPNEC